MEPVVLKVGCSLLHAYSEGLWLSIVGDGAGDMDILLDGNISLVDCACILNVC